MGNRNDFRGSLVHGPNLFLVGAPKCGTTAMHAYLGGHPDVFAAAKELHYFGSDLSHRLSTRITWDNYLHFFRHAQGETYRLDASVRYILSTLAAREIFAFDPRSRIVIMLRNPVDLIYSLHGQELFSRNEDIDDFEEALAAEEDRREGRRIPPGCHWTEGLLYRETGRLADKVERYLDVFPRDNVLILIFEEFVEDPAAAYLHVIRFLGLRDDGRRDFPIINAGNKAARHPQLTVFIRNPPAPLRTIVRSVVPARTRFELLRPLGQRILRANTVNFRRAPLGDALRERLNEEFAPEQQRLEQILGRSLPWSLN